MPKQIKGWWFSSGYELPNGDGRKVEIGITHEVKPPIELCQKGLHLSIRPIDALKYAPGNVIWKVLGHGVIITDDDKAVCTKRTYIDGGIDVSETLFLFARKCALDVIHLWDAPDVVVKYLKSGDKNIRDAARDAANKKQNNRLIQMLSKTIKEG